MRGRLLIGAVRRQAARRATQRAAAARLRERQSGEPDAQEAASAPARKRSRARRTATLLGAISIVVGLFIVGLALAQPVKALLGQWLLERAWAAALSAPAPRSAAIAEGTAGPKPWWWADMRPIAKLRFPTLGAERVVLDSASGEALAWAPGHVAGTAALGGAGLAAVAAHRDTHFALLKDLAPGDRIELEALGGARSVYEVISGHVVDARRFRLPRPDPGAPDMLALSTCWPFDSVEPGPERFVLFAARVRVGA